MVRREFFILLSIISGMFLSSCTLHSQKQAVDYKMLEQTAAMHLTQTYEAMPTATATFTPVPTDTSTPLPTATEVPIPTENSDDFMILRYDETENSNNTDDVMIIRNNGSVTETGFDGMMIRREEEVLPTSTPVLPTATVVFPDKADFAASLPSPNQFVPGQHFYLTWQLKNSGTTTWSGKYRFYYSDGIQLAEQSSYAITDTVEPGGILTVTMPAVAPAAEGTYKTTWTLENPDGIPFYYVNYITIVGDQTFVTQAPELLFTATPSSLEWMCSSAERSLIQGDGCFDYCTIETVQHMHETGLNCYVNGEIITYE